MQRPGRGGAGRDEARLAGPPPFLSLFRGEQANSLRKIDYIRDVVWNLEGDKMRRAAEPPARIRAKLALIGRIL